MTIDKVRCRGYMRHFFFGGLHWLARGHWRLGCLGLRISADLFIVGII